MDALTAVLLLIAGGLLAYFGERIGAVLIGRLAQLRTGVPDFTQHFRGLRTSGTDYLVYTLTARPHLPVTDVLYFELINNLLKNGKVRSVLVTVWWPRMVAPVVSDDSEQPRRPDTSLLYVRYLQHLAATYPDQIEVVHQFADGAAPAVVERGDRRVPGDAGLPDIFWSALKQLTSKGYYSWIRNLGVPARRLRHLNRARPGDQVLEGLVAHTIHNSRLAPVVVERLQRLGPRHDSELVLSVLFWELEVDRLAVYYELYDEQKRSASSVGFVLNPIAGRTIRASFRRPADNHTPSVAISMAQPSWQQLDRLCHLSRRETTGYLRALQTVLALNYGFEVERRRWAPEAVYRIKEWTTAEKVKRVPRLSRGQLELAYLIDEWRRRWASR